jgi:hypothetical protein
MEGGGSISYSAGDFDLAALLAKTASGNRRFAYAIALRPHKGRRSTGKGRDRARQESALSFHSFRRTATTLLHEAGIPAAVCQALIGHDSAAIHELYVSIGREALAKAAACLPGVVKRKLSELLAGEFSNPLDDCGRLLERLRLYHSIAKDHPLAIFRKEAAFYELSVARTHANGRGTPEEIRNAVLFS